MYVHAATAISPQESFERSKFLQDIRSSTEGKLYAVDAPYNEYISPVAIRRMSRILKITISAAIQCLKDAGVKTPDGIITGTGRGGVTDMELFVKDLIRLEEGALNPTSFIQSTYNSPNGWIAMQSSSTSYNQTYVHRGCSFELALLDAQMLLTEAEEPQKLLVGCYDEMTEDYFLIRGKKGYWKKEAIDSRELLNHSTTPGTIGGEGSAFFVVGNEANGARTSISAMEIVHQANPNNIAAAVSRVLDAAGKSIDEVSLVLTGLNGDPEQSELYTKALSVLPESTPVCAFKHLCGEYDTATGFGLWLADHILHEGVVPEAIMLKNVVSGPPRNILLVNHYILGSSSVLFISKR